MAQTKVKEGLIDATLGGGVTWDSTAKTANFPATAGSGYLVDTSSSAITVTLPGSPSFGDEIIIIDYKGNAGTNNITLGRNSLNIQGAASDYTMDTDNESVRLLYSDATQGWIITSDASAGAPVVPDLTLEYLVVAGGGGGGTSMNNGNGPGGGGAGGYRTNYGGTPLTLLSSTNYNVSVGPGGAGGAYNSNGSNGASSVFSDVTSSGGGGGGGYFNTAGSSGGSGGGGSAYGGAGGSGNSGGYTPVEGYSGGTGSPTGNTAYRGGGGGGSASSGVSGGTSGDGGDGSLNSITGSSVAYAGGGGGGCYLGVTPGSGGTGGGASGGAGSSNGGNGTNNTGGGAGGGGWDASAHGSGGIGGSGVVILKYPDAYTISETTSPSNVLTFTTDSVSVSGYKITTFTSGANGTIQFTT